MARYEKIFTLVENKNENKNCPIKFVVGALLKDTEKNQLVAQLKFTNISDMLVEAVEIDIITYDANGARALPERGYVYNGIAVNFRDTFGERTPIKIRDKNTVAFEVRINKVVYAEGSIWNEKKENAVIGAYKASQEVSKIAKNIGDESVKTAKKLGDESVKAVKKIGDESAKVVEKLSAESTKTIEKAGQTYEEAKGPLKKIIKVIGIILNTIIFVILSLFTAGGILSVMESGEKMETYMVIGVGICALISFPLFGHLLKKLKNSTAFRIARWVVIILILIAVIFMAENLPGEFNLYGAEEYRA